MQSPVTYLTQNPRDNAYSMVALWVVVILLVLYNFGYTWHNLKPNEGMSEPLRALYGVGSSNYETTELTQPSQGFKQGFTGGFKTQAPAFFESQALNDNMYDDGLGATSDVRYFTNNPEWAAFEEKVYKTLDSVQVRTRYHTTSTAEKIAILKMRAQQLGVPLPVSAPPAAEGMLGQRNKVSGMSDGKLVPNY